MLPQLIFPSYNFNIKETAKGLTIWDKLRKKYVALTPEEWVRQHLISYLVYDLGYSENLIIIESGHNINRKRKRTDVLVYNREMKPVILAECKAPDVGISQKTFDQIAVYNLTVNASLLILTNGLQLFCCKMDYENKKWEFMKEIPQSSTLSGV